MSAVSAAERVWLFDLDNTLHDAVPHVFPRINQSMTAYMAQQLRLSEHQAAALRVHYWHRYGATLLGLIRHHGVSPRDFLWRTHQFDDLPALLVADPAMPAILRRLPGRKIVFSNAPAHYAGAVLRALGLAPHFDGVFAIEHMRYRPKPRLAGFLALLRRHRLSAGRCVMVEDTAINLRTAKLLGMKTVWLADRATTPAWVDVRLQSLRELPRALSRL
ncbi:MAG: Phosphoglycolate phosphatase [Rhodocyclaceae bacterium]|nr:pyrimidine 5'-nucleotidase [Rhodocyclaceae bacterium]MCG3185728.1 Phosphoglycolate phosphatase [Rhodocyclaceae bacterium]